MSSRTKNAGKCFNSSRENRDEKRRPGRSSVVWEMYLMAVLHQESVDNQEVRCNELSFDCQSVHKPDKHYTACRQESFSEEKIPRATLLRTGASEVVFLGEREITGLDHPCGVNAKNAMEMAETWLEGDKKSTENGFLPSVKGKRRGAVCKQIEKELKIDGKSLRELHNRLVYCYSNYYYSLI